MPGPAPCLSRAARAAAPTERGKVEPEGPLRAGEAERGAALAELLSELRARGYRFTTCTPATHRRVLARAPSRARDLRDVLGWSMPFERRILPPRIFDALAAAAALRRCGPVFRSRLRVSSLEDALFLHSAYPTLEPGSVFFGPDTYRFARLLRRELPQLGACRRLVDLGAGTGAGAVVAARCLRVQRATLVDVNPLALELARINTESAGLCAERVEADGLGALEGEIDLIIANPPYLQDRRARSYRDGGDLRGARRSLEWARAATRRLAPGGRLVLYTGSVIVRGHEPLRRALEELASRSGCALSYDELDPDIFGEELEEPGYEGAERIAAVAAVLVAPG